MTARATYLESGAWPLSHETIDLENRGLDMPRKSHISLIVKGPLKSARRAAQRHGLSTASCHAVSGDVQCYAPCSTSTERKAAEWYTERSRMKAGRGHPPGTLLYYSGSCPTGGLSRRKRRPRRKVGGK